MARFVTRGIWAVVVLLCVGLVAWHLLTPAQRGESAPETVALPSNAAQPWGASGAEAPLPDAAELSQAVAKATEGRGGTYRVSVVDVVTGETLVDRDAKTPGTPASSLKLLTGAAALASFDHDHRFATTSTLAGDGSLRLVGGGDVLLGDGASDSQAVNAHAGLATLAQQTVAELHKRGEPAESYQVKVDASLFPGAGLNPDWADDLITTNNITEVQTPAMHAGRQEATPHSAVVRNPSNAALDAYVKALEAAAKKAGVKSSFTAAGHADSEEGAQQLGKVESATVLEQMQYMERNSDNYLAETLGRLVAVKRGATGSYQDAAAQVTAAVKELGVDTVGLDMKDTSGLAATNQVTPHTLAGLLQHAETSPRADLRELAGLLPVAGVTGTLAQRLNGSKTKALIRAKTGTLAAVVSLSGYVTTEEGRLLSFSVMASDVKGAIAEARGVADEIATELLG